MLAFVHESEQEMFDRDVFILETHRLVARLDDQPIHPLGHIDFAGLGGAAHAGDLLEFLLKPRLERAHRHAHAIEKAGHQSVLLLQQTQQQVLAIHFLMAIAHPLHLRRL